MGEYSAVGVETKLGQLIPRWVCSPQALQMAKTDDHPLLSRYVVPAVPWARFVTVLATPMQALMFYAVYSSSHCSDAGPITYQRWIWVCLLPYAIFRGAVEVFALSYYLPCYCADVIKYKADPAFKVLGFGVHFLLWFCFYMTVSTLNLIDLGTDSAFSATIVRATSCPDSRIEGTWSELWELSVFGKMGIPVVSIKCMAIATLILSTFQQIIPIFQSSSRKMLKGQSKYEFWNSDFELENLCGGVIAENTQLSLLSESAGLGTIQSLGMAVANVASNDDRPFMLIHDIPSWFRPVCEAIVSRVYYSFILENCVQVNIQSTLFAIGRHISPDNSTAQAQAGVSIALGLLMALLKFSEAATFFKLCKKVRDSASQCLGDNRAELEHLLERSVWHVRIGCVMMLICLMYAAAKLFAAYYCDESLWNITGCVEVRAKSS